MSLSKDEVTEATHHRTRAAVDGAEPST